MMKQNTERISTTEVVKPKVGVWFRVILSEILRELFEEKRKDEMEEKLRIFIQEAFHEIDTYPAKYGAFETIIPDKTWGEETVGELHEIARKNLVYNITWVYEALEMAYRISKGEKWETICKFPDEHLYYRIIIYKDGYPRYFGGARKNQDESPEFHLTETPLMPFERTDSAVPKFVRPVVAVK